MDTLIIFLAKDLFVFVVLIWLLTLFKVTASKRVEFIAALILAAIVAIILDKIAGALYFHPRPFAANPAIKPLVAHGADNGFPSEHTILAMTLTTLVYYYRKKFAAVALLLAILVGAGRVWAHVHSWVDILGGLAIGAIAGYIGVILAQWLLARRTSARRRANHH